MVKLITNISETVKTSVGHPVGEGFYLFIIQYAHNCLENMLKNLQGNGDVHSLGSMKGFMLGMDHGCFRNVGGDSHDEWERVYVFRNNLEFEKQFEVQIKIVFCDVRNSKIWGQT